MTRLASILALSLSLVIGAACGGGGGSGDDTPGDDDGGTDVPDADPNAPDAPGPDADLSTCDLAKPECSDGCDNDNDGQIDGFDIECTGEIDDDESSFATGIPGDNQDTVKQDCFFDGNSGAGAGDGCDLHICCILSDPTCPDTYDNPPYDPNACGALQTCIDTCGPLAPPGCDCFGCCTICDDQGCVDIYTNPAIAPNCDADSIHDPVACPACVKVEGCGSECDDDPNDCILCPGQDESDLPPGCNMQECPNNGTVCTSDADCTSTEFCSNGCCIAVVN